MIEHLFQSLLPSIEHFHLLGYWVAFVAALLETALVVGLLLPGSTLLLLLGALTATGQLDFAGVFWFAVAGAILGDNLNYWLGRRYGHRWVARGVWFLKSEHIEQARRFFDRHGAKSVFLGRFIPSIKEVAPFIAGSVGMRRGTFFFWNVLGGIGWGLQWVGGGYLFGQSLKLAQVWMSRAGMLLLALLLAWLALWLLKRALLKHGPDLWLMLRSLGRSIAQAIAGNPFVQRLLRRHPRLTAFLGARLDRTHFYGLPLTLLSLAFLYVLALFGGIVEDFISADPVVAVDHATAQLVATFRPQALIAPFIWITALGVPKVVAPLLLLTAVTCWVLRRAWCIPPLLVSSLGAALFTTLGKFAFARPRPAEALLLVDSWSFPSGHASIAVAFYGFLGYLLIRSARSWRWRVNWLFVSGGVILLIGLSRIVLGVHYLSDVWAGYLVGALWLIIGISLSEWLSAAGRLKWHVRSGAGRRWLALGLGVAGVAWYVGFTINWQPPRHSPHVPQPVELTRPLSDYLREGHNAFTRTMLGDPEQPLGLALVAEDDASLLSHLRMAGWQTVDRTDLQHILRLIRQGMDYTTAPLAPAFWNGRINDFALAKPVTSDTGPAILTLRLWRTVYRAGGKPVYVGVARGYEGIRWGLLHRVSPDVDATTAQLVASLRQAGLVRQDCRIHLVEPMIGRYLLGERFFTRGQLWLLNLTPEPVPALGCDSPAPGQGSAPQPP